MGVTGDCDEKSFCGSGNKRLIGNIEGTMYSKKRDSSVDGSKRNFSRKRNIEIGLFAKGCGTKGVIRVSTLEIHF